MESAHLILSNRLKEIKQKYADCYAKLAFTEEVKQFFDEHADIAKMVHLLPLNEQEIAYLLIIMDQKELIFLKKNQLELFLKDLEIVHKFYKELGGILGYQQIVHELLSKEKAASDYEIEPPSFDDIRKETIEVKKAIVEGIKRQSKIAEIYPIGGAADRLNLHDDITGKKYPAARLNFLSHSLLEWLIRDLFAREYLHFKMFGEKIETPIFLMTSHEKDNETEVRKICEENNWFGRNPHLVMLISQPQVPVFNERGKWIINEEGELCKKPGGHGVIWKLLKEKGAFKSLAQMGIHHALVRQINNPIGGVDIGLLALIGIGFLHKKKFGVTTCPQKQGASEGVHAIKVYQKNGKKCKKLSNIEYCENIPYKVVRGKPNYPANSNVIFVDLDAVQEAVAKTPFPGFVCNFKKSHEGSSATMSRLESTMQNIIDSIEDIYPDEEVAFLTFGERRKTLSTIKRISKHGELDISETREGCFYDYLQNMMDLLQNHIEMKIPEIGTPLEMMKNGPSFYLTYHPSLGPAFSIIRQKIKGGRLLPKSKLELELSDLYLENVEIDGSLSIKAPFVIGEETGKCFFKNNKVINQDYIGDVDSVSKPFNGLQIVLQKNSYFYAENVTFKSADMIEVPENMMLVAEERDGKINYTLSKLASEPRPFWVYETDENFDIKLTLQALELQNNRNCPKVAQ